MAARPIPHSMTATALNIEGYRATQTLGVVRGVTVRSRSIFGTIGASLQTLAGGNISLFTQLCEKRRAEAFDLMRSTRRSWAGLRWSEFSTTRPRSYRARPKSSATEPRSSRSAFKEIP